MTIKTKLNIVYYASITVGVIAAIIGFLGARNWGWIIDAQSTGGIAISYIIILYIMLSVPGGLGLHNRMLKRLNNESLKQKEHKYLIYSIIRLVCIAIGFAVSILFFYILRQQSLIFCAGIAAIGIYFCKPTEERIAYELSWTENKKDNQ